MDSPSARPRRTRDESLRGPRGTARPNEKSKKIKREKILTKGKNEKDGHTHTHTRKNKKKRKRKK